MNEHVPSPMLGIGLYPLSEAAKLAQLDAQTTRRWAEGYDFRYRGELRHSPGVMGLALEPIGGRRDLTFPEMLTLRLVKGFRGAGLTLRTIKRVAEVAAADYGTATPLVTRRFRTDGRNVFIELQAARPDLDAPAFPARERQRINVLSRQREFGEIVEPSLFQNLEWDDDLAARWWPLGRSRSVMVDPRTLFGAPHIEGTRVPTAAVAATVRAEGSDAEAIAFVADWHGISPAQTKDAVEFETRWFRKAA
jgi:uncharacterized protein (DUF433 family)